MLRRTLTSALLSLAVAGCSATTTPPAAPAPGGGIDDAVASINPTDVEQRIAFLASDELRGRDTPSPGLEAAANYAAEEFRRLGLRPAGDDETYIQRFPFDASTLDRAGVLVETRERAGTHRLEFASDYFVIPARVDSVAGTPLFLGPARGGVLLPPEAAGRPVAFFVADTGSAAWQMAAGAALQSSLAARAAAVVLVMAPAFPDSMISVLANQLTGQILPVPMPVIGLRYAAAARMFGAAGLDLDQIRDATAPTSLEGLTLALRTPIEGSSAEAPNVVAILPGSDSALSREYVVFSAHIDHVGVGEPDATGDSIYNGADDDASGTTAVLEIAEAFASLAQRPARSMIFLLVSAEEDGLLGSQHFVEEPTVPLAQIVANINIDMVGRNAPDTVVAIGQDYSSLGPAVQRVSGANPALGLVVAPDLWPEEQLFFRSDHFSFAMKEIPAIFFTTGLHEDYHRPSDEPETIDSDKLARVARLLFRFGHELASRPERPQWTEEGRAAIRNVMRQ
ncbi:MAG TPA: M20/M25/M40 family metallo-hydrolase [Longimicrobiales bacterium]